MSRTASLVLLLGLVCLTLSSCFAEDTKDGDLLVWVEKFEEELEKIAAEKDTASREVTTDSAAAETEAEEPDVETAGDQQQQETEVEQEEVEEYRELAAIFEEERSLKDKLGNLVGRVQRRLQCAERNDKCGLLYGFKRCCSGLKCSDRLGKGRCVQNCEQKGGSCTFRRSSCCDGLQCKKKGFLKYRCE